MHLLQNNVLEEDIGCQNIRKASAARLKVGKDATSIEFLKSNSDCKGKGHNYH